MNNDKNKQDNIWCGLPFIDWVAIMLTALTISISYMELNTNVLNFGKAAIGTHGFLTIISIAIASHKDWGLNVVLGYYCVIINMMAVAFAFG